MERAAASFERFRVALGQILAILPGLILAFIILLAGFLVARTLERLADGALERMRHG